MAMRRPRVKVAANLSIRRPSKASAAAGSGGETKPVISAAAIQAALSSDGDGRITEYPAVEKGEAVDRPSPEEMEVKRPVCKVEQKPVATESPVAEESAFKFPKPVEEPPRITTPAPVPHSPLEINTAEEPHSPKKLDSKFAYINALNSPRKRIRTESMTSNKSYSDVSLKSRKTIKQEESQKASDAKRDLRKRLNNIQNIDKQSLTMFDMIYYNPVKNPMKSPALSKKGSLENIPRTIDRETRSVSKSRSPTPAPMAAMVPPEPVPSAPPPPPPTLQMTPQIKLGPNGEMILDEASLVVENEREKAMRDSLAKAEIVYMDEFSGNSGYYSRYKRTRDWPPEETIRFYRCLHTIGTDFSMMIQLFPNRTRRDLKLKFKKEERLNLKLINKALLFPKEFNIEELKQQFEEEDEEIARQREQERQIKAELEEKMKQQKMSKKLQLNQSKNRNPKKRVSKAARVMLDIEKIANAESMVKETKPKRKRRKATPGEQSAEPATERKPRSKAAVRKRRTAEDIDVDAFNEAEPVDISDGEPIDGDASRRDVGVSQVDSVPYIPNGGFEQEGMTPNIEPPQSTGGPSEVQVAPSDCQLNIDAMDIDIVDEQSRSLYAIKAEPAAYPVRLYESASNASLDAPSVVTLQNLDDSQSTVTYRRSKTSGSDQDRDLGLESIESKYYGGCEVVYLPVPAASAAHPVKTESSYSGTQQILLPAPMQSPPLQYDLHTIRQSDYDSSQSTLVKPDAQESETSQESYPEVSNPSSSVLVSPDETNPSSDSLQMKPEVVDSGESPTEDSTDWQESEYSEEQPVQDRDRHHEEEQTDADEEPRGLGPLEDIDINSLVLVESQDANDPTKTIYEIYVTDPETGKLSERPLDVPDDVIENIRSILEGGEE